MYLLCTAKCESSICYIPGGDYRDKNHLRCCFPQKINISTDTIEWNKKRIHFSWNFYKKLGYSRKMVDSDAIISRVIFSVCNFRMTFSFLKKSGPSRRVVQNILYLQPGKNNGSRTWDSDPPSFKIITDVWIIRALQIQSLLCKKVYSAVRNRVAFIRRRICIKLAESAFKG